MAFSTFERSISPLSLLAVLLDRQAVALDAALQLLDGEPRVLRDAHDGGVHLALGGLELELLDDAGDQLGLDQPLEGLGVHVADVCLGGAARPHALLDWPRELLDLRDQHDLAAHLGGDAVEQLLGGANGQRQQAGDNEGDEG